MPLKVKSGCFRAGDELHTGEVRVNMEVEEGEQSSREALIQCVQGPAVIPSTSERKAKRANRLS